MHTDFYGLNEPPFQLTPDPRFYYPSAGHRKAMAYLGYGLAQGEGFVVITGEIGAGKSTLVAHLMATVDPVRVTVASVGSTQVDGDDMLRLAAAAFGITGASKAELLGELEAFLQRQARSGRKTLLVVDEAQALSLSALEELRMLSNFAESGRALLQIFLLGQPEFRTRLESDPALEQLRQRVIAQHHLGAMTRDEVEPYVIHRLSVAGWSGRPAFGPNSFGALHDASGGLPRKLNLLAARLLLHGALAGRERFDAGDVAAAAADLAGEPYEAPESEPVAEIPHEPEAIAANEAIVVDVVEEALATVDALQAEREWVRRVELLELRLEEQEAAIRRMLTLMVSWVESGDRAEQHRSARAA